METVLTIIGLVVGAAILGAAIGITIYKSVNDTKADLSPRSKK